MRSGLRPFEVWGVMGTNGVILAVILELVILERSVRITKIRLGLESRGWTVGIGCRGMGLSKRRFFIFGIHFG